jgi:predicted SAM-dependent methyltransferase
MGKKLNVGCGNDYKEGWINLDLIGVKKDITHDLNKIPYPFQDNEFAEILMKMILEHVDKPIIVLKEIIRISVNGAKLIITVPHAYSYANFTDIQHRTHFTESSFSKELLMQYELENLQLINQSFLWKNKRKKNLILELI